MVKLFEGTIRNWKFVLKFIAFSAFFWLIQFLYQFYFASQQNFEISMVRAFGFSGATFIALSLLSSSIFKFFPKQARHVNTRRSLGVMGFVFILFHVMSAINFVFKGNVATAYFSFNPFENPIIWGQFGYMIFFLLAITSTDWAMQKLGTKWKAIHRLVYFGFYFTVFHFITINPPALMNLSGYLLLLVTAAALLGELYWFAKISAKSNFKSLGTVVGAIIILLYLAMAYYLFFGK